MLKSVHCIWIFLFPSTVFVTYMYNRFILLQCCAKYSRWIYYFRVFFSSLVSTSRERESGWKIHFLFFQDFGAFFFLSILILFVFFSLNKLIKFILTKQKVNSPHSIIIATWKGGSRLFFFLVLCLILDRIFCVYVLLSILFFDVVYNRQYQMEWICY